MIDDGVRAVLAKLTTKGRQADIWRYRDENGLDGRLVSLKKTRSTVQNESVVQQRRTHHVTFGRM
jgi:hypothetical protein